VGIGDVLEMQAGTYIGYMRYYYLKDHLGSVRVTLNQNGAVAGYDDYYPFGLQMPGRSNNSASAHDDQKFTGHFLEQEDFLDIYHAGARMYDPAIGRFLGVDAMRGLYPGLNPYNYVMNNPTLFVDPTGNCAALEALQNGEQEDESTIADWERCQEELDPPEEHSNNVLEEIGTINNLLAGAGASSTGIKSFWEYFYLNSHANVKDAALKAGLSVEKIDEIIAKHKGFANAARFSGYFFLAAEGGYGVYNFSGDPSLQNFLKLSADLSIASYAVFGPHGIKVAIAYQVGKQSHIIMIEGLEQGIIRPNPSPTRGLVPGLAPVHIIPNH